MQRTGLRPSSLFFENGAGMSLSFTQRRFEGTVSAIEVSLDGVINLADANLLQKTLRHTVRQGYTNVVVNLRRVRDIDKAAWDCLVSAARRLKRAGGHIILRHCPDTLFAQLLAHRWERCFLMPERRAEDARELPEELRAWAVDKEQG
jgi:anti-anti-sigma factor